MRGGGRKSVRSVAVVVGLLIGGPVNRAAEPVSPAPPAPPVEAAPAPPSPEELAAQLKAAEAARAKELQERAMADRATATKAEEQAAAAARQVDAAAGRLRSARPSVAGGIEDDAPFRGMLADWAKARAATDAARRAGAPRAELRKFDDAEDAVARRVAAEGERAYGAVIKAANDMNAAISTWQNARREADLASHHAEAAELDVRLAAQFDERLKADADKAQRETEAAYAARNAVGVRLRNARAAMAAKVEAARAAAGDEAGRAAAAKLEAEYEQLVKEDQEAADKADATMRERLEAIERARAESLRDIKSAGDAEREKLEAGMRPRYEATRAAVAARRAEFERLRAAIAGADAEEARRVLARSRAWLAEDDRSASERLARRLPELNFNGHALSDVLDFVRDVTGQEIAVDWDALKAGGVTKDSPITYAAKGVPALDALGAIAKAAGGKEPVVVDADAPVVRVGTASTIKAWDARRRALLGGVLGSNPGAMVVLMRRLPEVRFDGTGLGDVFEFLSDVSGLRMEVDLATLGKGTTADAPVSARLRDRSLLDTLVMVLQSVGAPPDLAITTDATGDALPTRARIGKPAK